MIDCLPSSIDTEIVERNFRSNMKEKFKWQTIGPFIETSVILNKILLGWDLRIDRNVRPKLWMSTTILKLKKTKFKRSAKIHKTILKT